MYETEEQTWNRENSREENAGERESRRATAVLYAFPTTRSSHTRLFELPLVVHTPETVPLSIANEKKKRKEKNRERRRERSLWSRHANRRDG